MCKTWTCPRCGVIPAKELRQAPGSYIRQLCACEERLRGQDTGDWQTALREQQRERTYTSQPQGTLALFGPYGVGKTHLLAAIANEFGSGEKPCLSVSAITLFEVLQERIQQGREYHDLLKRGIHTPLLLMDDLDKVKPSEFRESISYLLIDKRRIAERPIALSCNVSPSALERWIGKAAHSRLMMGLCPVEMRGADYRLKGGQM